MFTPKPYTQSKSSASDNDADDQKQKRRGNLSNSRGHRIYEMERRKQAMQNKGGGGPFASLGSEKY